MINKYEAIGIFVSIALMAVVLAALHFQGEIMALSPLTKKTNTDQGAVVVSAPENEEETELKKALGGSMTHDGELTKLIINEIKIGEGTAEVKKGDTVTVDYIGATREGVQFDSSYLRGVPFTFTVGEGKVIQGWEQGLLGMKVGGQRVLVIPAEMAYGDRQVGPISPNTPLVFSIELKEIN